MMFPLGHGQPSVSMYKLPLESPRVCVSNVSSVSMYKLPWKVLVCVCVCVCVRARACACMCVLAVL